MSCCLFIDSQYDYAYANRVHLLYQIALQPCIFCAKCYYWFFLDNWLLSILLRFLESLILSKVLIVKKDFISSSRSGNKHLVSLSLTNLRTHLFTFTISFAKDAEYSGRTCYQYGGIHANIWGCEILHYFIRSTQGPRNKWECLRSP